MNPGTAHGPGRSGRDDASDLRRLFADAISEPADVVRRADVGSSAECQACSAAFDASETSRMWANLWAIRSQQVCAERRGVFCAHGCAGRACS